ncbi:hypothetical protein CDCA_CDCA02G0751 [Cyanidium caldarium]|uniref:non-specific serine/threonine protein kinase n=1 Tax=Cyanidium caldarium TaxID=2771 RepID=A0AAV9IRA4_CYACA|nr:hypothetical protein CDCA_CDCA02G0751 [Cyanidium caldarium]
MGACWSRSPTASREWHSAPRPLSIDDGGRKGNAVPETPPGTTIPPVAAPTHTSDTPSSALTHLAGKRRQEAIFNLPSCDLIRFLGQGMVGTVVLVRERATGTFYAVKVMSLQNVHDREQERNVQLELEIVRNCGAHPFIVKVEAGYQTREAVVLVLEYVSGGDMYNLLERHRCVSEDALRFYLVELALALGHLHARGYVCRDLKVENVLIDGKGHVRLTDFGLAGRDADGCFDRSGTPIYQAPEVLRGERHGRLVDWWALGVLAYFLLAGTPPFYSPNDDEVYRMILDGACEPKWQGGNLTHASACCRDLLRRLLERHPHLRLGSGNSLGRPIADVDEVLAHPFFADVSAEMGERAEALSPTLRSMLRADGQPGVDLDKFLRYEVVAPLPPTPQPAADFLPEDVQTMKADQNLYAALTGRDRPQLQHVANMVHSRPMPGGVAATVNPSVVIPGYKVYVSRTRAAHSSSPPPPSVSLPSSKTAETLALKAREREANGESGDGAGVPQRPWVVGPSADGARLPSSADNDAQTSFVVVPRARTVAALPPRVTRSITTAGAAFATWEEGAPDRTGAAPRRRRRTSIGLNFSGTRKYLFERTWTGTDDDEGRVYWKRRPEGGRAAAVEAREASDTPTAAVERWPLSMIRRITLPAVRDSHPINNA